MTQTGEPFDPYYHWLGIPPDEQPPNHYRLLGIQPLEANQAVIQNAADRQMAHLRTFQSGPQAAESQRLLNEVAAARVCLLTAERKAQYDQQLRNALGQAAATPPRPPDLAGTYSDDRSTSAAERHPVQVESRLGGGAPTTVRRRSTRRAPAKKLKWLIVGAGVLLAAVALLSVPLLRGPGNSDSRTKDGALLVLKWPAAERVDASVTIDGQPCDLTKVARKTDQILEFALAPGRHRYQISRPRHQSVQGVFELRPNQQLSLVISLARDDTNSLAPTSELLLVWNADQRINATLQIDGRPYDLSAAEVGTTDQEVRIPLSPGRHSIAILRDGRTQFARDVEVGKEVRIQIESTPLLGLLQLQWRAANRHDFSILLDGEVLALDAARELKPDKVLEWELPTGDKQLQVRKETTIFFGARVHIKPGARTAVDIDRLIARSAGRLILQWPLADRVNAILDLDGQQLALPSSDIGTYVNEFPIEVAPGQHVIRVTRAGCEPFESAFTIADRELAIDVNVQTVVSATISPQDLARLSDEYMTTFSQFDEYRLWTNKTDAEDKQDALRELLNRMSLEASRLPPSSPEQYVAYDKALRLATEHTQVSLADAIVRQMRSLRLIGEQQQLTHQREIRDLAISTASFEQTLAFLRTALVTGEALTPDETKQLVGRIASSPRIAGEWRTLDKLVISFERSRVFDPSTACHLRAEIVKQAAEHIARDPNSVMDFAEHVLPVAKELIALETESALRGADDIVDTANRSLSRVASDRSLSGRQQRRAESIRQAADDVQALLAQYRPVIEARDAIVAGKGDAGKYRLWGLWLLEQGKFGEALPHLQQSGVESLVAIAQPLPTTPEAIATLADTIELESKKTRYRKGQKAGLRSYSEHVRQLVPAATNSTSNSPPEMSSTDSAVNAAAPQLSKPWQQLEKDNWFPLDEIVPSDALQAAIARQLEGMWTMPNPQTFVTTYGGRATLEIPTPIEGSYGLSFVYRVAMPLDLSVDLPIGDTQTVQFTLGAAGGRFHGLQLIDGQSLDSPANFTALENRDIAMNRNKLLPVEIHVTAMPPETQSMKQRKVSGGEHWTRIVISIAGKQVWNVSVATTRLSSPRVPPLAPRAIGFSTATSVAISNIRVSRHE